VRLGLRGLAGVTPLLGGPPPPPPSSPSIYLPSSLLTSSHSREANPWDLGSNKGPPPPHTHTQTRLPPPPRDAQVDMAKARKIIGSGKGISGNVDPLVLLGPEAKIRESVRTCVSRFFFDPKHNKKNPIY
jgi:hypothetical protein